MTTTPATAQEEDLGPGFDPTIPPISYCRVMQVGPICPRLCADCAATYRRKREMERNS